MEAKITKLSVQDIADFEALVDVFAEVFEMKKFSKPGSDQLLGLLGKPNFLTFVAKTGDRVLGGLTAYILDQYYSKKPLAYIYDLAVLTQFQRQGIGKALIQSLTTYCREKGFEEVFVQADKIDRHALDFYRSTKPDNEEDVIHFYYSL